MRVFVIIDLDGRATQALAEQDLRPGAVGKSDVRLVASPKWHQLGGAPEKADHFFDRAPAVVATDPGDRQALFCGQFTYLECIPRR